jgi:hypothetical protein
MMSLSRPPEKPELRQINTTNCVMMGWKEESKAEDGSSKECQVQFAAKRFYFPV